MTTTKTELKVEGTRYEDVVGELLIVSGIYGEKYEENSWKAEQKDMDPCGCCGRAVKPGRGFMAWALYGSALAPVASWDEMEKYEGDWVRGDLGVLVFGPECGKQVPKAYRVPNPA